MSEQTIPQIKWSQTSTSVTLVFRILHQKDTTYTPAITLNDDEHLFVFDATVEAVTYHLSAKLFAAAEDVTWQFLENGSVICVLRKTEPLEWTSPFHKNAYKSFVAVDWHRWSTDTDSDDDSAAQQQESSGSMPDFASMMQGQGGAPDLSSLMGSLGGGGEGMPDMAEMMKMMGGGGGMPSMSDLTDSLKDTLGETVLPDDGNKDGDEDEEDTPVGEGEPDREEESAEKECCC
jgi:hypothetical protein